MDYIFRRLALDYLPFEHPRGARHLHRRGAGRPAAGPRPPASRRSTVTEMRSVRARSRRRRKPDRPRRPEPAEVATPKPAPRCGSSTELLELVTGKAADAPLCFTCGTKMRPAGSCYVCEGCGSTSGCS